MLGGHTKLLLQALHLHLQVLAVGCCLLLQVLVLPGHFWEPGKGEGYKREGDYRRESRRSLCSDPSTCDQAGAPAKPDPRAPLAG